MSVLVQQSHLIVTSPVILPMSEPRSQFRYGMENFRPNSSMLFHQGNIPHNLRRSQQEMSFMQPMNNSNFPQDISLFCFNI